MGLCNEKHISFELAFCFVLSNGYLFIDCLEAEGEIAPEDKIGKDGYLDDVDGAKYNNNNIVVEEERNSPVEAALKEEPEEWGKFLHHKDKVKDS